MSFFWLFFAAAVGVAIFFAAVGLMTESASAAGLVGQSDVLSRLKVGQLASHQISFVTPSGVGFNKTVTIRFGSGAAAFSFGTFSLTDYQILVGDTADCDTSAFIPLVIGPGGIAGPSQWGLALAGDPEIITLTSPTGGPGQIPANRCLRLKIGSNVTGGADEITNGTVSGVQRIYFGGTFGDTGFVDVALIPTDQVVVSALVATQITMNISDTDVEFGLATPTESRYATGGIGSGGRPFEIVAHTIVAETNNAHGYTLTAQGATMHTTVHSITPIGSTPSLITPGIEQFGIRLEAHGGAGVASYPYDQSSPSRYAYTGHIASVKVAEALVATTATIYDVHYGASVDGQTPRGGYTSDFTYIATANL